MLRRVVLSAWPALFVAGCASHASIYIVPLGARRIGTTEPLVQRIRPQECYYWLNERNELCLALHERNRSLLNRLLDRETWVSFVLGEPPAGSAREYAVSGPTFRARHDSGLTHLRSVSLTGIVAVWDYGKARLRCRFRLTSRQQSYSVLTGWTGDARVLYTGELTAVHNPTAGQTILGQTEEGGLQRRATFQKRQKKPDSAVTPV